MDRFIEQKKNNWERLEDLLAILDAASLRGLSKSEVRELGELYRRAAADLAIAREESRDQKLLNYLNSLVIRAHGKIYRAEGQGIARVREFFVRDFPETFRRSLRYIGLAFGVFTVFAIAAFILSYNDFRFAESIGVGEVRYAAQSGEKW